MPKSTTTKVRTKEEIVQAAVAAAEAEGSEASREFRLANGVTLSLKPVPPLLMRRAVANLSPPKVPTVYIDEKGREEENPNDPAYVAAVSEYEQKTFDVGINVLLLAGTAIADVPSGVSAPEAEEWVEQAKMLGVEVDVSSPRARYLSWLQLYALSSLDEIVRVTGAVGRLSNVREEDVTASVASFRRKTLRGADNGVSAEDAGHGDNLPSDP